MLDEIVVVLLGVALARGHADHALAAAPLGAIGGDGGALDEAIVRERDDHAFIGDEVFDGDLAFRGDDLRAALAAVFLLNLAQLVRDDLQHALLLREDVHQVLDRLDELVVFALDAFALQAGELVEAQVEDVADLLLGELVVAIDDAAPRSG